MPPARARAPVPSWKFTLLAAAYTAGILLLSSIPGDPKQAPLQFVRWVEPQVQNLLHVPLFAGLSWTWCRALSDHMVGPNGVMILAFLIGIGFGAVDEWYQSFVPGRYASLTDVALNIAGAGLGVLVWRKVRQS